MSQKENYFRSAKLFLNCIKDNGREGNFECFDITTNNEKLKNTGR